MIYFNYSSITRKSLFTFNLHDCMGELIYISWFLFKGYLKQVLRRLRQGTTKTVFVFNGDTFINFSPLNLCME